MSGVRPSSLPLAEHCGHSVLLSEKYREGSQHTEAGNAMDARIKAYVRGQTGLGVIVHDPEAAAILATLPPHRAIRCDVRCTLTDPDTGELMWPEDTGELDIELEHDDRALTIVDIKNGRVRNYDLQLQAYGLARALETGAPRFRTLPLFVNFPPHIPRAWIEEADYWGVLERIRAANARRRDEPITGLHCQDCHRRTHCQAFMLPAYQVAIGTWPTEPGAVNETNAGALWLAKKAMEEAAEKIEALLKTYAAETGGLRADGKVWGPVYGTSRRGVSLEKAEAAGLLPALEAAGAVTGGRPGESMVFRWRNEKEPSRVKRET